MKKVSQADMVLTIAGNCLTVQKMNWKKYECFQLEKQAYRYESIWYQILKKVKK